MKKTFAKKRVTTISETQANKSSNIRNPTIIRISTDKAIKTDKDGVKRISTYLKKYPDASVEDIMKLSVDYGDGTTSFKLIDIEKSDIKYDMITLVNDNTLRISANQVIRGPPHLIKKAYEYVRSNPSIVSTPEKIIQKVDEPRYINVEVQRDEDNWKPQAEPVRLTREETVKRGDKLKSKIVNDDIEVEKEIVPQLYLIDETVKDEDVEDYSMKHFRNLTLFQKYNALGTMLQEDIANDIREKIESQRENISRTIDVTLPTEIDTAVFPDYSKRRPPFEKKYNPFDDTIEFTDSAGNIRTRRPASKLQKRMTLDTQKRKELGIRTQLIDVKEPVTRAIREYMTSQLFDNIYKKAKVQSGSVDDVENNPHAFSMHKARFFQEKLNLLPKTPDVFGAELYNHFVIARDAYLKTSNLNHRSVLLNHMTDIVVDTFKRMYPKVYGMFPYVDDKDGYEGFYERLNTVNPGTFQANLKRYLGKNLDKFAERDASIERTFKKYDYDSQFSIDGSEKPTWTNDEAMYYTRRDYNTTRIGEDFYKVSYNVVSNRQKYIGNKIADFVRKEIAYYISNNLNADYEKFIVLPDFVNPTADDIHRIEKEYAAYKEENAPSKDFVRVKSDVKTVESTTMPLVIQLENNIYKAGDSIYEYFYNSARVLQFYSSNLETVSKYSNSLLQRIELGDISVANLYNYDYKTLLPEFFLNTNLNIEGFNEYIEYSQRVCANDILNVWIYTQTHKESRELWYSTMKPAFNPESSVVSVEKMCGSVDSTVFVVKDGNVKCISRKELKENIKQFEAENTDELSTIVNGGIAPMGQFKEFVDIASDLESE